jgi:hypothetical protein
MFGVSVPGDGFSVDVKSIPSQGAGKSAEDWIWRTSGQTWLHELFVQPVSLFGLYEFMEAQLPNPIKQYHDAKRERRCPEEDMSPEHAWLWRGCGQARPPSCGLCNFCG